MTDDTPKRTKTFLKGDIVYSGSRGGSGINAAYKPLSECHFMWVSDEESAKGYMCLSPDGVVKKFRFTTNVSFPQLQDGDQVFEPEDTGAMIKDNVKGYYTDHRNGKFEICIQWPREYLEEVL